MQLPSLIRIGTRASRLALAQSEEVKRRLQAAYPALVIEIFPMTTAGDRVQDKTLNTIGGKGLFTKEIEEALLAGTVDIAVHSMKDMPTLLPEGLTVPCLLEREDPADAFLSLKADSPDTLPKGATIGTSSLRRAAQMKAYRPDLVIVPLRGNVHTRLGKLEEGVCDATLLAVAGLKRLSLHELAARRLSFDICLPAVAQGAIGIECRINNSAVITMLESIHHPPTALCAAAERSLLATLDGSCRTPIAGLATLSDGSLTLEGLLAKEDGSAVYRHRLVVEASTRAAIAAGKELGHHLLRQAK